MAKEHAAVVAGTKRSTFSSRYIHTAGWISTDKSALDGYIDRYFCKQHPEVKAKWSQQLDEIRAWHANKFLCVIWSRSLKM